MSGQKFYASPTDTFRFACGAIGYRPGGPFDCLGPYAKVLHCRIAGTLTLRRTVYATGYPNTFFSIPACCKIRGKHIGGYLFCSDSQRGRTIEFRPYMRFMPLVLAAIWVQL